MFCRVLALRTIQDPVGTLAPSADGFANLMITGILKARSAHRTSLESGRRSRRPAVTVIVVFRSGHGHPHPLDTGSSGPRLAP